MTFDDWVVILTVNKANPNINEMKIEWAYSFFFKRSHKQSKLKATLAQSNKWLSNPKPKWFPQIKTFFIKT